MRKILLAFVLWSITAAAAFAQQKFDAIQLLTDIKVLSADSMEGRRTGTPGSERARRYILQAFENSGAQAFNGSFEHSFSFVHLRDGASYQGVNVVGYIPGTAHPDTYVALTAHYDHLGVQNGQIYNGADDNASGTAALMAAIRYFSENRPQHSIIFVAFDAEEMGLQGARAFVSDPPVEREQIVLNVNMDMISRNDQNELYAAGTYHYPFLKPYLEQVDQTSHVQIRFGHDRPDLPPGDDWTLSSDHGAFHEAGIPFVYFGVEDHPDYHRPTDVYENIQPGFYINAVNAVLDAVILFDAHLQEILAAAGE